MPSLLVENDDESFAGFSLIPTQNKNDEEGDNDSGFSLETKDGDGCKAGKTAVKMAVRVWAVKDFNVLSKEYKLVCRTFFYWDAGEASPLVEAVQAHKRKMLKKVDLRNASDDVKKCIPLIAIMGGELKDPEPEITVANQDYFSPTTIAMTVMFNSTITLPSADLSTFPFITATMPFQIFMPKLQDKERFALTLDDALTDPTQGINSINDNSADDGAGIFELKPVVVKELLHDDWLVSMSHTVNSEGNRCTFEVQMKSKPAYWVLRFILPEAIISFLGFLSWGVPPGEFGGRCGITLTLLLTLFALKIVASTELPRTTRQTYMDMYCLIILAFQFMLMVGNMVVAKLEAAEKTANIEKVDNYFYAGLFGAWLLIHSVAAYLYVSNAHQGIEPDANVVAMLRLNKAADKKEKKEKREWFERKNTLCKQNK